MCTFYSLKYVSQGIIGLSGIIIQFWNTGIIQSPAIIEIENKMSDQGEKKLLEEEQITMEPVENNFLSP